MKYTSVLVFSALMMSGCGAAKDAVEEAAEDAIDGVIDGAVPELVEEGSVGVATPAGWDFLVAIDVSATQSAAFDNEFAISLDMLETAMDAAGIPGLPAVENQLVLAKVVNLGEPYGNRLQFSRKAALVGGELKVDNEIDMGTSGDLGAGVYAFYHSGNRVGFFKGSVSDCDGNPSDGALVVSPSSPFVTYTDDGRWAIPSITANPTNADEGQASQVFFEAEDCSGSVLMGAPEEEEGNPKVQDIPEEEDVGESILDTEVAEDGTAVADAGEGLMQRQPDVPEPEPEAGDIDFEDGTMGPCMVDTSMDAGETYAYATVLADHYDLFFPGASGDQSQYLFLSSGGTGRKVSQVYCRANVPADATTIEVSYNFISQEYSEWVGSGFNDMFTVKIDGSPDSLVNRTINNAGAEQLWEPIAAESASVGAIAESSDASYNGTGPVFDGQLKVDARGANLMDPAKPVATADISKHAGESVVITLTVGDAGDSIFDTAALVDYISIY